jgi:hypothetical protein
MFNHQFRQSLGQMEHKPDTMFGNVKADVPADNDRPSGAVISAA